VAPLLGLELLLDELAGLDAEDAGLLTAALEVLLAELGLDDSFSFSSSSATGELSSSSMSMSSLSMSMSSSILTH